MCYLRQETQTDTMKTPCSRTMFVPVRTSVIHTVIHQVQHSDNQNPEYRRIEIVAVFLCWIGILFPQY